MKKNKVFLLIAITSLIMSCNPQRKTLSFLPSTDMASPGEVIILKIQQPDKLPEGDITVSFGKQLALIVDRGKEDALSVMVPDLPPSKLMLTISTKGKTLGETEFIVQRTTAKMVHMTMQGKDFKVLRAKGSNDEIRQFQGTEGKMLAFDVLEEKGELVMTGTIPHPEEMELFDDPKGKMQHEKSHHSEQVFSILIPNAPGKLKVRFYEPDPAAGLQSEKFMSARKFINEVILNQ